MKTVNLKIKIKQLVVVPKAKVIRQFKINQINKKK